MSKNSESPASVRLQKFAADLGLGSRREMEVWISEGRFTINGEVAQLGAKVGAKDAVKLDDKLIFSKKTKTIVLAMNKPKHVVCTNSDPFGAKTVFDILPKKLKKERLFCVGRLDKESEGLVLLTNDGELANRIMHPSFQVTKRYTVTINRDFIIEDKKALLEGVTHDGERLFASKVVVFPKSPKRLEIHLNQGRKREIRRLLEALGYFVKTLKRFQIGKFRLKLPTGAVQELTDKDIRDILS
ncbi:MAG: hypothetical protein A2Y14_01315 [Verrucomicrobia bacterium GWF2_51_19]|nr:MAG: hypothetical protein A2Y14_01315 [Verrucomicrobia bacterium GWF2_51_19]HCJ11715.1 rRNA pseudouridine synthase [Opitutae bacterium]